MGLLTPLQLILLCTLTVVYLYRKYARKSIANIPGPKSESFLLGNLREFYQGQVGEADFKWQEEFGGVVRMKTALGGDRLMISDPKAVQYVYQTSAYGFIKLPEERAITGIIGGRGLAWAEGEIHKRHRKAMLPAFGIPESRSLMPVFRGCIRQVTTQWNEIINGSPDQSAIIDLPSWMSRAALDAIGQAAFDYEFGALGNVENPVTKSYTRLFTDMFSTPTTSAIFVQSILRFFPVPMLDAFYDYAPIPQITCARDAGKILTGVAKDLVREKTAESMQGKSKKDLLSLLVKASSGVHSSESLNEEELYEEMRTIILTGHETTGNEMVWGLFELAKHPEMQTKLRAEIRATEASAQARGDDDLIVKDFDNMPYTTAVMKEIFRFHPTAYNNFREAATDEILPLSRPITTTTGEVITEIPIPKGTKIVASIAAYNRDKTIWGEDSHVFRPERWLDNTLTDKKGPAVGVYGNLLTFGGGARSCIGARFAIVEMQAFLVELVGNFEFSLTERAKKIRREACMIMVPTIEGEVKKGGQLPLKVSVASRD